jgi:carboxyl-terminal processing protease
MNRTTTGSVVSRAHASLLALAVAMLALAFAACGVADDDPPPTATAIPPTVTATGPTATATPDPQVLLRDGGIAIIALAYDRLLDEYIEPLEPAPLLADAWTIMAQEASALGVPAPPQPSFAGDRGVAFAAFRDAYVPFANSVPDPTKLRHGAIRGMTQGLQDCHTFFLSPVASDTLVDSRAGRGTVGIGIELAGIPPLVTEVITGGPAARAGVAVGDHVAAIDGTDASSLGPSGALELINGDEGTEVSVRFRRPAGDAFDVTVRRERVTPPNVDARVIDGRIGYVRVRNFVDDGVRAPLRDALSGFEAQGLAGWIIDLRGNPGGRLDPEAISLFVKDGVVVRDRGRTGAPNEVNSNGETLATLRPTVLLTNNRTGSVAEVFAAALQEYGVAYVIGANTNGCVGYTDIRDLGDGSSLAVTTHVNLGPVSGINLNGIGVAPDLAVARTADDIANARDPQLDAAVAHLSN